MTLALGVFLGNLCRGIPGAFIAFCVLELLLQEDFLTTPVAHVLQEGKILSPWAQGDFNCDME